MNLAIVAAPLFEGRPEVDITQAVLEPGRHQVYISDPIAPNCGAAVYESNHMAAYYLRVTGKVIEAIAHDNIDTVFWVDAWNPALDALLHWQAATGRRVRHFGIWHSSPITPGDYLKDSAWAVDYQDHLLDCLHGVFVATRYMKEQCFPTARSRERYADKVHVTGLPFNDKQLRPGPKLPIVVFGHRWSPEKRPERFIKLAQWWREHGKFPLTFQVFTPSPDLAAQFEDLKRMPIQVVYNPTKDLYFQRLGQASYIWADSELETFGYSILEGFLSGTVPILNDHPCYREMYSTNCLYSSFSEQITLLETLQPGDVSCTYRSGSVERMFDWML